MRVAAGQSDGCWSSHAAPTGGRRSGRQRPVVDDVIMNDLGACPRCGKPVERQPALGAVPDCVNACRVQHRGEWEAARHGHILRELQTLVRPDDPKALPPARGHRRCAWSVARAWN